MGAGQTARMSSPRPPRIAVRAIILHDDRLLLVNAWKGRTHLWCAPGGGAQAHASLPDNLIREIHEETGLMITVGAPCLVNEFHDPSGEFHQVDIYFRCTASVTLISPDWRDPEGIVTHRRWVTRAEMAGLRVKPDSLAAVAWGDLDAVTYDPLEPIVT
jgi:8-oxo-dGTP diphosphatase